MPIIISKNGKDARRVERTSSKKEEDLLIYISENPDCFPLEDINYTLPLCLSTYMKD